MYLAYIAVSLTLAALLCYAALRKLSRRPDVVASYARVGVPERRLGLLATVLLAGAAGLLTGIFVPVVGIIAACALVLYFLAALAAHTRARDLANAATPLVLLVLAALTLVLRTWTA
jgi:hypothetical protein